MNLGGFYKSISVEGKFRTSFIPNEYYSEWVLFQEGPKTPKGCNSERIVKCDLWDIIASVIVGMGALRGSEEL